MTNGSDNVSFIVKVAAAMMSIASITLYYSNKKKYKLLLQEVEESNKAKEAAENDLASIFTHMKNDQTLMCHPIGYLESCFSLCVGTPRQGQLAPSTRAKFTFTPGKNHICPTSLDGLQEFSHVWLTFVFHLNTKSNNEKTLRDAYFDDVNLGRKFKAKIVPPMLKEKKGVFATRSPHRPNCIGITMARIEEVSIKKKSLLLSGVDLVEGTPILDIKPYVPFYDTAEDPVKVPSWIENTITKRREVLFPQELKNRLIEFSPKLKLYKNNPVLIEKAITEVLAVDIRSKHEMKKALDYGTDHQIDNLCIKYSTNDEDTSVTISDIKLKS